MPNALDFLLHSDKHLLEFVHTYGNWVYGLLFAIVFAETGFVVTPFLPFVAGVAQMAPSSFAFYNLVGAIGWVGLCFGAGWFFGNVPVVKEHFSLVTIGIVIVSILPMVVEYVRHRRR